MLMLNCTHVCLNACTGQSCDSIEGSLNIFWQDLDTPSCHGTETVERTAGDPKTGFVRVQGTSTSNEDCLGLGYLRVHACITIRVSMHALQGSVSTVCVCVYACSEYSFTLSAPDSLSLKGLDLKNDVRMMLTRESVTSKCFNGLWAQGHHRYQVAMAANLWTDVYVVGNSSANACPARSVQIDSAIDCATAAKILGWRYNGDQTNSTLPNGCYFRPEGDAGVYFDRNALGTGESGSLPICRAPAQPMVKYPSDGSELACSEYDDSGDVFSGKKDSMMNPSECPELCLEYELCAFATYWGAPYNYCYLFSSSQCGNPVQGYGGITWLRVNPSGW